VKIFVEKNMTALMPDSCCANMIMTEMNNGMRSAGFINNSRTVTLGISFIDSYSVRISSISSWTSIVPRNQDNAATRKGMQADEKRKEDKRREEKRREEKKREEKRREEKRRKQIDENRIIALDDYNQIKTKRIPLRFCSREFSFWPCHEHELTGIESSWRRSLPLFRSSIFARSKKRRHLIATSDVT